MNTLGSGTAAASWLTGEVLARYGGLPAGPGPGPYAR